jgi:hypothetical protein
MFVLAQCSLSTSGLEMKTQKNAETISFRIAAVTEHIAKSSFSPNRETYLVYLVNKTKPSTVAKVVFRYLDFEDGLSEEFADFGLVHTFKAKRDRFCDEAWQSFSKHQNDSLPPGCNTYRSLMNMLCARSDCSLLGQSGPVQQRVHHSRSESKTAPSPLSWSWSIRRDFGWDPLLDHNGNRMKWTRRITPVAI